MRSPLPLAFLIATACSAIKDAPAEGIGSTIPVDSGASAAAAGAAAARGGATAAAPAIPDSIRRPQEPLVPTPDPVRGLYVNRWAALGRKQWELIDVAKRTEVNALVLDVKDDRGFVLYRSNVPLVREIGADTLQ